MAKDQKATTTAPGEKKPKVKKEPTALRKAINATAEATGLPINFINKQVLTQRRALVRRHRAEMDELATRVPQIVGASIAHAQSVVAPAVETAGPNDDAV